MRPVPPFRRFIDAISIFPKPPTFEEFKETVFDATPFPRDYKFDRINYGSSYDSGYTASTWIEGHNLHIILEFREEQVYYYLDSYQLNTFMHAQILEAPKEVRRLTSRRLPPSLRNVQRSLSKVLPWIYRSSNELNPSIMALIAKYPFPPSDEFRTHDGLSFDFEAAYGDSRINDMFFSFYGDASS